MKKAVIIITGILLFIGLVKFTLLSHVSVCNELESSTDAELSRLNYCERDEDCTYIKLSCPFECSTPLHRSSVKAAQQAVSKYHQSCMMVCPECPKDFGARMLCVDRVCQPATMLNNTKR